jgi:dTDP-4-amino-4,6-dideoxygalactose transaminase
MIFLSHGAVFDLKSAWHHLWVRGQAADATALKAKLRRTYGGEVTLYYNCRTAISQALAALPAGSAVAVNGLTCYAVPQAIRAAGYTTKYLDVEADTLNFSAKALDQAARADASLRAVIVQNMLGLTVDIAAIERVARRHKLLIIEDLAHAAGAFYPDGRSVGTIGDATVLSFGKGKVLDTTHGGALIIRSPALYAPADPPTRRPSRADRFRDRIYPLLGVIVRKCWRIKLGPAIVAAALKLKLITKSADGPIAPTVTMANWQARLVLEQLQTLSERNSYRRGYAATMADALEWRDVPTEVLRAGSVPIRLPILVHERSALIRQLRRFGYYLDDIWYDVPVSPQRHYHQVHFPEADCPVATRIASQLINLPTDIPLEALAGAVQLIRRWQQEHGRV